MEREFSDYELNHAPLCVNHADHVVPSGSQQSNTDVAKTCTLCCTVCGTGGRPVSLIEIEVFEEHCSKAEKETLRLLRLILNNQENIMSQLDDLNIALAGIQTTVTGLADDAKGLEDALAALQAANPGVDLSGPLATAQAINASLSSVDAGLKAAVPAPPPPPAPAA